MKMITLKNAYTNETFVVELIRENITWQKSWVVRLNGVVQTVAESQGWYIA
jgi:hypothetical protein